MKKIALNTTAPDVLPPATALPDAGGGFSAAFERTVVLPDGEYQAMASGCVTRFQINETIYTAAFAMGVRGQNIPDVVTVSGSSITSEVLGSECKELGAEFSAPITASLSPSGHQAKTTKFSDKQLDELRKAYGPIKTVPTSALEGFRKMFADCSPEALLQLCYAKINFVSKLAVNAAIRRGLEVDYTKVNAK